MNVGYALLSLWQRISYGIRSVLTYFMALLCFSVCIPMIRFVRMFQQKEVRRNSSWELRALEPPSSHEHQF